MTVSFNFYQSFKQKIGLGVYNLTSDTFKVMLVSSAYTPNYLTHALKADVTGELATGNGYTAGGITLASKTWAAASGTLTFDADDVTWTASGGAIGPAAFAIVYDDTPTGDPLVCCIDFGETKSAGDGTDFKVNWNAAGIFTLA